MHLLVVLLTMAVIAGFVICVMSVPMRMSLLLLITLFLAFTDPWMGVLFAFGIVLWLNRDEISHRWDSEHKPGRAKIA
jgi:hypothetical protein